MTKKDEFCGEQLMKITIIFVPLSFADYHNYFLEPYNPDKEI